MFEVMLVEVDYLRMLVLVLFVLLMASLGFIIGERKKRPVAGTLLGLILGPVGLAVISLIERRAQG